MVAQPIPQAIHIGRFDTAYPRVHAAFRRHLEGGRARFTVAGQLLTLVTTDIPRFPTVIDAIVYRITEASVALVDLTPAEVGGALFFNPNVIWELGRAEQLGTPTFRFCHTRFRQRAAEFPFDIKTAPIAWYDDTEPGLKRLCRDFGEWFDPAFVSQYHYAQPFMRVARRIRAELFGWPGDRSPHFRALLVELMQCIYRNAVSVSDHLHEGSRFTLVLPQPEQVLDIFLAEAFKALGPGDGYDTFSNLAFLMSFADYPSRFHEAILDGARTRGVTVRRILLLGTEEPIDDRVRAVLEHHQELAARPGSNYHFRCLASPEPQGYRDARHCGLFHGRNGSGCHRVVFKPRYEHRDGRVAISGLEYDPRASAHVERFEHAWNLSLPVESLGPDQATRAVSIFRTSSIP